MADILNPCLRQSDLLRQRICERVAMSLRGFAEVIYNVDALMEHGLRRNSIDRDCLGTV